MLFFVFFVFYFVLAHLMKDNVTMVICLSYVMWSQNKYINTQYLILIFWYDSTDDISII